jgi:DNA invertase Pin-like site-specific DNA recombinase
MLKWVRQGDVIEVHSIDRMARNVNDLLQLVKIITEERHAEIYFIKENLRFNDDSGNPFNQLTLQIIGAIAEFERNMIKMRQKEGIAIAKQKGVYSKERCKKLSLSKIENMKKDVADKVKITDICRKYNITKPTFYRYRENYGF